VTEEKKEVADRNDRKDAGDTVSRTQFNSAHRNIE
jgi:hypothetical protein